MKNRRVATRLVLALLLAGLLATGISEARASTASKCAGSVRSPVYTIQEPQYQYGKTVEFHFLAPDCAQIGQGASYAIGKGGMTAADFTWSVYLAGGGAAPQPLFTVGPTDWSSSLAGDFAPPSPAPSGCQALYATVGYATNRPTSTGGDGPTRQIYITVSWSSARTPSGSGTCNATSEPAAATTTTTEKPESIRDHLARDLAMAREDQSRIDDPRYPIANHFEISADRSSMTGALIFLEGLAGAAKQAEAACQRLPGSERDRALAAVHDIQRLGTRVENADKTIDADLAVLQKATTSIGELPKTEANTRRLESIRALWTAAERQKDQIQKAIAALPASLA